MCSSSLFPSLLITLPPSLSSPSPLLHSLLPLSPPSPSSLSPSFTLLSLPPSPSLPLSLPLYSIHTMYNQGNIFSHVQLFFLLVFGLQTVISGSSNPTIVVRVCAKCTHFQLGQVLTRSIIKTAITVKMQQLHVYTYIVCIIL